MAIHSRNYMNRGDVAVVLCTHQCNVMLLDDANFANYRRGARFQYQGGHFRAFPARIQAPTTGNWNVVLDPPNGARYGISIAKLG